MAQAYFSLVTTAGRIKLAASAAGADPVVITHFAVGDGNGAETNPTAASTALVREVWRTPVESVVTDPDNPAAVLVTAIIPTAAGGWWMREFGIFDNAGAMIAVARPVSQYKPTALEGQLEDIRYEFQIIIGETANVTLLVDPSLLFATREWVINRKIPMAQMMRTPWLPVVSMTVTAPPAAPAIGDTYLVPAGATGAWAAQVGKLAEWTGAAWSYLTPPNGQGISLPDGRIFQRIGGIYIAQITADVQSGKWSYAQAAGTPNALTASLDPAPAALRSGMNVRLKVDATNPGPATLNLNGHGVWPIVGRDGFGINQGDLLGGDIVDLTFDDGRWIHRHVRMPGALLNVRVWSVAGTVVYVPTPGTRAIIVDLCGGGGGAGGAGTIGGPYFAVGGSGGGGARAISRYTDPAIFAGQLITIGAGGLGALTAVAGNHGQPSSFGSLMSASGGDPGSAGLSLNPFYGTVAAWGGQTVSGGNLMMMKGCHSSMGWRAAEGSAASGAGGDSPYGGGGAVGVSNNSPGQPGRSPGAGGSGGVMVAAATTQPGGNGADGLVIIYEHC